jgi:hypothetical protein
MVTIALGFNIAFMNLGGGYQEFYLSRLVKMPTYPMICDIIAIDEIELEVEKRYFDLDECPDGSFKKHITTNSVMKVKLKSEYWRGSSQGLDEKLAVLESNGWNISALNEHPKYKRVGQK